ncbi:hypothetical protein [Actinoplanes xinjiangensis]|uniref:hypothetical protein n=1 Tax=Actinoplanes xinjiangensis TaxID=512350 RepID=UPI00342E87CD
MSAKIIRAGLAALATATVLLSGCGDAGGTRPNGATTSSPAPVDNGMAALTAEEILAKSISALAGAGSYRVTGTNLAAGDDGETMTLDVTVTGGDLTGRLTLGQGADIALLAVGGAKYVKPDPAAWARLTDAGKTRTTTTPADGRWIPATRQNDLDDLFTLVDVTEPLKPGGIIVKGRTAQVDGTPAITLIDPGADAHLAVAATGEPYPLRLFSVSGDGDVSFSDFGATFDPIIAPAANEIADPAPAGR